MTVATGSRLGSYVTLASLGLSGIPRSAPLRTPLEPPAVGQLMPNAPTHPRRKAGLEVAEVMLLPNTPLQRTRSAALAAEHNPLAS